MASESGGMDPEEDIAFSSGLRTEEFWKRSSLPSSFFTSSEGSQSGERRLWLEPPAEVVTELAEAAGGTWRVTVGPEATAAGEGLRGRPVGDETARASTDAWEAS
ncbi:MAG: hypothetical protein AAGK05_16195, partial [Pseudomonadota bacterium]